MSIKFVSELSSYAIANVGSREELKQFSEIFFGANGLFKKEIVAVRRIVSTEKKIEVALNVCKAIDDATKAFEAKLVELYPLGTHSYTNTSNNEEN